MRGDKTLKILDFIGTAFVDATDLLEAFLSSGYGATPGRVAWELRKIERRCSELEAEKQAKQNYYNLLYKLKKEGLIREDVRGRKRFFALTHAGRNKLVFLRKEIKHRVILPSRYYAVGPDDKFTIISFDIPESERRKRNWLRSVIKNLGFTMVQKSVWVGKVKIPQDFLEDLRKLKLISFVEIFEISKSGSLKHVA